MSLLDEIRSRATQPTVEPRIDVLQQDYIDDTLNAIAQGAPAEPIALPPSSVSELKRLEELLSRNCC